MAKKTTKAAIERGGQYDGQRAMHLLNANWKQMQAEVRARNTRGAAAILGYLRGMQAMVEYRSPAYFEIEDLMNVAEEEVFGHVRAQ